MKLNLQVEELTRQIEQLAAAGSISDDAKARIATAKVCNN